MNFRHLIARQTVRSAVTAVLMVAAGMALYLTLGITAVAAVLFAGACGIIVVAMSYFDQQADR